jgi:CelD/BcsL family acetyltransferase involved in cellulose biosynthesis
MTSASQPWPAPQRIQGQLEVEFVGSSAQLTALLPEWHALWFSLPDSTPFQSPAWLLPRWQHYNDGQLCSFAFRCAGSLVGLAPLYIYAADHLAHDDRQQHQVRRVFLLGTGNTDYVDLIVRPEYREHCVHSMLTALCERAQLWDTCEFLLLPPSSPLLVKFEVAGVHFATFADKPCPVIRTPLPSRTKDMIDRAAYYRRRLQRTHPFVIESATENSLDTMFTNLERLHSERWHARGRPGVLNTERDRQFHHAAAHHMLRANLMRMYELRSGSQVLGVFYGFAHRGRSYSYLSGFAPEFASFSIGSILLSHAITQAVQSGCQSFDFLTGDESYKYRWGASDEPTFRVIISKLP